MLMFREEAPINFKRTILIHDKKLASPEAIGFVKNT